MRFRNVSPFAAVMLSAVWTFVAVTALVSVRGVSAVAPVSVPAVQATSSTVAAAEQPSPSLFGLSKRYPALISMRGGQVHEPETADDVESLLVKAGSEGKLTVIDFSATWCGPCKMIAPLFKELSEGMSDVVFIKVDVDENPDTAAKYNVSAMPTFVFIKGGEVVDRLMGANPGRLQELIDMHK